MYLFHSSFSVIYPAKKEEPPEPVVASAPFQAFGIAVDSPPRMTPTPEPPKRKPTRRVMFATTRW